MTTTKRFSTLMQREWMQHRVGWMIVMAIMPVLALCALPFDNPGKLPHNAPPATMFALLGVAAGMMVVWGLSWAVAMFQMPGLARRDQQDRSIEFWMSLPASHTESVAATLLMHALLIPMLALAVGAVSGLVLGAGVLIKLLGFSALASVSWGSVLAAGLFGLLRLCFGMILLTLWMAPLFMLLMAASAWLKRWGTPVFIGAIIIVGNVLDKLYDNPIVWRLLSAQFEGGRKAMFDAAGTLKELKDESGIDHFLSEFGGWVVRDAGAALQQLASPHLIGGLVVAAGCFALVILNRKRST